MTQPDPTELTAAYSEVLAERHGCTTRTLAPMDRPCGECRITAAALVAEHTRLETESPFQPHYRDALSREPRPT